MRSEPGGFCFVDLSPAPADAELLSHFYETLYVAEFPDPNERESLTNMLHYLKHGYEHENAYIVTLVYDGRSPIGGAICDYFVRSNCGVIEFLTVAPHARGRNLGTMLARHVERRMMRAAAASGRSSLALIMAEINDPFKRTRTPDNLDPFKRLHFWNQLGYRRACFPYVQPALSPEQSPVTNLLLAAKTVDGAFARAVDGQRIVAFLRDYLIYAMRLDHPDASPEFVAMRAYLERHPWIPFGALDVYTGDNPRLPLDVRAVQREDDPDFGAAMVLYRRAFSDPAFAVAETAFVGLLRRDRGAVRYHLWTLRTKQEEPVSGFASFFALDSAGFGGYVAFELPLRGTRRLPGLIARIERTLIRDGATAEGWYAECIDDATVARFVATGFAEVAVSYRQPPDGPPLKLLYKEFGATYGPPVLGKAAFLTALREIAHFVYEIEQPESSPAIVAIIGELAVVPGDAVPFVRRESL